ncbi:DUF998 domain-containing protein [Planotetraspora kaengkrachanensis]|uniref:DUF998 domain-containing protein n=1 Tax=Planotetraspora kaengkrachanensis TaxID=575193 RepID=A0A8J3PTL0_9ACTN|nr:DUF998 domain-containing protein [Planotetraspora kaengkrachanensis]GIG80823.1 hypothetical protein Pka01_39500 [Planotetraspora kaengkrachanensis]
MVKRLYPLIACGGILYAVIYVVTAQVAGGSALDPVTMTISEYASLDRGIGIEAAMAVLGLSSLALTAGMRAAGAPIDGWPRVLLTVWSVSLIAAAFVPTTAAGREPGWATGAHLVLSAAAFVSVPVAATLLAGRLGQDGRWSPAARPVEWLALAGGLGLAAITYVALPGHGVMVGLVERLLLSTEVAVLLVLAVRLLRLTWAGTLREVAGARRRRFVTVGEGAGVRPLESAGTTGALTSAGPPKLAA